MTEQQIHKSYDQLNNEIIIRNWRKLISIIIKKPIINTELENTEEIFFNYSCEDIDKTAICDICLNENIPVADGRLVDLEAGNSDNDYLLCQHCWINLYNNLPLELRNNL